MSGYTLKSKRVLNILRGTTDEIAVFLESFIVQGRLKNIQGLLNKVELGPEPHFDWEERDSRY